MYRRRRFQSVRDHGRRALYAAALVVSVGSLWTYAWAANLNRQGVSVSDKGKITVTANAVATDDECPPDP